MFLNYKMNIVNFRKNSNKKSTYFHISKWIIFINFIFYGHSPSGILNPFSSGTAGFEFFPSPVTASTQIYS